MLNGTIPTEIGFLTSLTYLNLFNNALAGSLPQEIEMLTGLTGLYLGEFFPVDFVLHFLK